MIFSLIICTYKRPKPIISLLDSVVLQTVYPNQILIVDGSIDNETADVINSSTYDNLIYYKVPPEHRGLTRQRNYGIERIITSTEVVCFLDDDTILESNYFEELIKTYQNDNSIIGVGGVDTINNNWKHKKVNAKYNKYKYFCFEDYYYPEGLRNVVRNYLGLASNLGSGKMPEYSHGRTCGFPLNGKVYEVDLLIGMSFSFKRIVTDNCKFSSYFEGYGLYEDADYSIRAQQYGINVINTNAKLAHYHDASGRPNKFQYGKMVVRNGWYVWRVKYPNPSFKAQLKWHAITLLLTAIRLSNALTSSQKREAATESIGRIVGWLSLLLNKPKKI
jgi:GT2 family glycosyltransferase